MIKILIIPGHGGKDRANKGPTGYIEADGVLSISLFLEQYLKNTGSFEVYMSRRTDKTVTASERYALMRDIRPDLMISEHTNAGGGKGCEVYYSITQPKVKSLAANMSATIAAEYGKIDRGARTRTNSAGKDYYGDIRNAVAYDIGAALIVESLFHDNAEEEAILKSQDALKRIAELQAIEICKYYGIDSLTLYGESSHGSTTTASSGQSSQTTNQTTTQVTDLSAWKTAIIEESQVRGLISDKEKWLKEAEDGMPAWAVLAIANKLDEKIEKMKEGTE